MDVRGNLQGHDGQANKWGSNSWLTYSPERADLGVKFVESLIILSLVGILLGS